MSRRVINIYNRYQQYRQGQSLKEGLRIILSVTYAKLHTGYINGVTIPSGGLIITT